jgi:LacI family transcriptional regulator
LAQVAQTAGVDPSTVSRVLRKDANTRVGEATRQRIITTAAKLGYVANANARSLVSSQTMTLGLLIPNMAGFVYVDIIRGAEVAAREAGYVLVVIDASDQGRAGDAFHRLVLEGRVDGLLIASGIVTDNLTDSLLVQSSRCVVLNRRIGGHRPSVIEDDEAGMQLGVEELIRLGHRRIACLTGPADVDTARRRLRGYRNAMRNAGLPVPASYVVHAGFEEAEGYAGMKTLLAKQHPPTALAVASVTAAIGALAACHEARLQIPEDISFVAFHDAPVAEYLQPPLTTIAMPLYELGHRAANLLVDLLNGRRIPNLSKVTHPQPRLLRRKSIAAPRADD